MLEPELAVPPDAAVCVGAPHANVVPARLPVSVMLVVFPEQIVCATGLGVTVGNGFTVIGMISVFPAHPPESEVTVYVAVPLTAPVAVSVCAMLLPEPAEAPLVPVWLTVHE